MAKPCMSARETCWRGERVVPTIVMLWESGECAELVWNVTVNEPLPADVMPNYRACSALRHSRAVEAEAMLICALVMKTIMILIFYDELRPGLI